MLKARWAHSWEYQSVLCDKKEMKLMRLWAHTVSPSYKDIPKNVLGLIIDCLLIFISYEEWVFFNHCYSWVFCATFLIHTSLSMAIVLVLGHLNLIILSTFRWILSRLFAFLMDSDCVFQFVVLCSMQKQCLDAAKEKGWAVEGRVRYGQELSYICSYPW